MIRKLFAFISILVLLTVGSASALDITVKNCAPHTGVGIVRFNDTVTDYEILEELRVYSNEEKVWKLEPGLYGITHFSFLNGAVLYYRNIEVKPEHTEPVTYDFGCGEKGFL